MQKLAANLTEIRPNLPNFNFHVAKDEFLVAEGKSFSISIVNGYIATTKKPPDLHGFGLQNVKTALKKYDSFYDMAYEDGYFAFTIEMENDLPSATKTRFSLHES